jgi:hypothetical protein
VFGKSERKERKMSNDMVEVPRRLLEELSEYLGSADGPMISVPGQGEWAERMIRELQRELLKYPAARAVLDHAAQRAGELVSLAEIAQHTSIGKQQIANELAGMSKATRRLFGSKKWPFQPVDTAQGMSYLMQPEIARWWLAN